MINTNLSISAVNDIFESFEDRIGILFSELELAAKWQRPSIILAVYSSEFVRADADITLVKQLHALGQSAYHIKIENHNHADISQSIHELGDKENAVFFVEGLRWGTNQDDYHAYHVLNDHREFFLENNIRIVFWLTEKEALDLAHHAPDYWTFRHRVIEFVDSPRPNQIAPHILDSAWQGQAELIDKTNEDLDAKIALRTALLTDLPDGSESTFAKANLNLTLGMLHWRRGDFEKAIQSLNIALDLSARLSDNTFEALCFNAIALVKMDQGRVEDAIQAFQNAVHLAPDQISPWNNLGQLYRKLNRNEEALAAYQKAIDKNASDPLGWNGLGDVHHETGRNEDAIYSFLKAIEIAPCCPNSWCGLGNSYLSEGQLDEALAAHQKAIALDQNNINSWLGLGRIYKMQADNENAKMAYQKALELDPKNAMAWNGLGDLSFEAGLHAEAMKSYQKAMESGQGCPLSYANMATIQIENGCPREAIPLLLKATRLPVKQTEAKRLWNALGDVYRQLDDYDLALVAYRNADAIETSPVKPETAPMEWLDGLASVMPVHTESDLAEVSGTVDVLEIGTDQEPPASQCVPEEIPSDPEQASKEVGEPGKSSEDSDFSLLFPDLKTNPVAEVEEVEKTEDGGFASIGGDQEQTRLPRSGGETDEAKVVNQSQLTINEKNAKIWNELGKVYYNTGAFVEAIHAFEMAIELDPAGGWSYNNLASIHFHQKHYRAAIPLYQKGLLLIQDSSDKALVWNQLGDAYHRLNENNQAAAAYRKAIELDPENVSLLTRARFSLLGNTRA
jgi:tetratricopeptide (TPR) repeat protein